MARVVNQVYDGSAESYTDAAGDIHYHGEAIRQAMPDAYPLPSVEAGGVTRRSARGYRPSLQGKGSPEQLPWRMCFQECSDRWNELPDECPALGPCPTVSSKKNVWDAKQEQGVMCSYYDLYMACCMSYCTTISIEGQDGTAFKGGTIPPDDACWPCESPCKTSTLSIAYTTQQMLVGETQALHAHDSTFGDDVPCCLPEEIEWRLLSGGGFLNPSTGLAVNYIAPDENPECVSNPVIELSDCCGRTATLELAVNSWTTVEAGRTCCTVVLGGVEYSCHNIFNCRGIWQYINDAPCVGCGIGGGYLGYNSCTFIGSPELDDTRTAEALAGGCCPWQLI